MRRFILKTLLAVAAALAICAVPMAVIPPDNDAYLMAYKMKSALLDTVPSPRVILVGGSNVCFGVDSRRLSDSLGMPVVDCGLTVQIGLKYMLDDAQAHTRPGDVVVILAEFNHFNLEEDDGKGTISTGDGKTLAQLLHFSGWENFGLLDARQKYNVITNIDAICRGRIVSHLSKTKPSSYRMSGFNEFGDYVAHLNFPSSNGSNVQTRDYARLNEKLADYMIEKMESMSRQATVVLTPQTLTQSQMRQDSAIARQLAEYLDARGHGYQVPVQAHALPDSCSYDTPYHMNRSGIDMFTTMLIDELKPVADSLRHRP